MSQFDNPTGTSSINSEDIAINYFANDKVTISNLDRNDEYILAIYDLSGKLTTRLSHKQGTEEVAISVAGFQSGLYILVVQNNTKNLISNKKLLVQ